MHICIVGGGASGWITYHHLKHVPFIQKITLVASPKIPTIGVGESTTIPFREFLEQKLNLDTQEKYFKFLLDIDFAFKYGVNYEGWSEKNFLHSFPSVTESELSLYLMGNKNIDDNFNDFNIALIKHIYNNEVYLDTKIQNYTYHFDAAKFIEAMKKLAIGEPKLDYIENTVVDSIYKNKICTDVILSDGCKINADYFISCIGQTAFNQKVFDNEYISYSDKLLTTKALFYPLEYKDRKKEMHPYTVAKSMKHGWRWITPTSSRIGTGYVFSDNHITIDQAMDEFIDDIGDKNIEPKCVDFYPRRVKETFKLNTCVLGMASGFLEPLDAPGLAATIGMMEELTEILIYCNRWGLPSNEEHEDHPTLRKIKESNIFWERDYNEWCSFILHQYKTSNRNDTQFWIDHKNVKFDFYDELISSVFNPLVKYESKKDEVWLDFDPYVREPIMFFKTTSGKDVTWNVKLDAIPTKTPKIPELNPLVFYNQSDMIEKLSEYYGFTSI